MKIASIKSTLFQVSSFGLILLLVGQAVCLNEDESNAVAAGPKRLSPARSRLAANRQPEGPLNAPANSVSAVAISTISSHNSGSSSSSTDGSGHRRTTLKPIAAAAASPQIDDDNGGFDDEPSKRPAARPKTIRKYKSNRPTALDSHSGRGGDDCDDEDDRRYGANDDGRYGANDNDDDNNDDYGRLFMANPMRHFRRMMNNVFDRMPIGPNFGSYDDGDGIASSASAFSQSGGDGYSRLRSSVTNNGRTRGIISETRNGRTKTRRIGDHGDDDVDDNIDE